MSTRNKWLYADYLEEALGKPEQAERVRAMSLVDWDQIEPQALERMADQRAAESRAHAAERTRRWRHRKAEESRARAVEEQRLAQASRPPAPTGDAIVDLVRRRAAGLP